MHRRRLQTLRREPENELKKKNKWGFRVNPLNFATKRVIEERLALSRSELMRKNTKYREMEDMTPDEIQRIAKRWGCKI